MSFLRQLPKEAIKYLVFTLFAVVLVSLQSSLWLQVFGFFPAPYLWIPILCYWAITRSWVRGFLMVYLLSIVLFTLTGLKLEVVFFTSFGLFFTIYLLRDRIMWKGHSYFSLTCYLAAIAHPLLVIAASYMFETQPVRQLLIWDWILSPLFTALFAVIIYNPLIWLDQLSFGQANDESSTEFL